jgi:DNA-binding HxlR family transcriptional regulator
MQDALYALSGKWKLPIIIALTEGPMRFKDLERAVVGITPKMLSKELRELELNEFVLRTVHPTVPVAVEYSLTEYSESLREVVTALSEWGLKHRARMISS